MRLRTKMKRSASESAREASPELGEDVAFTKRNSKTGRPIRNSAGKRTSLHQDFVASDFLIANNDDEDSSFSDSPEIIGDTVMAPRPKRRRISLPPPELSPEPEVEPSLQATPSQKIANLAPHELPAKELSMTFYAPPGHVGPFVVKLDLSSLSGRSSILDPVFPSDVSKFALDASTPKLSSPIRKAKIATSSSNNKKKKKHSKTGFLNLPPEIRNAIYRQVFISKQPIDFRTHSNFKHSGGFLSTCRTVYHEATQILYGDNEFKFARDSRQRGSFWSDWTEIGWKDIRRFLTTIGTGNIPKIRKLWITFEDPSHRDDHNPYFTNDDHLMDCLKLLANHGRLEKLSLAFHGKTMVKKHDTRFLENIKAVKADKCEIVSDPNVRHRGYYGTWYSARRVANVVQGLDKEIAAKIQRSEKLYERVVDEED